MAGIIQETDLDHDSSSDESSRNNRNNGDVNLELCTTLENEINGYLKKLNEDIGFYWWKYYTYCAFWSNISVPINLTITILTALTTGQTATGSLIDNHTSTIFGIVVLIVSIFNTFFRPTQQLNDNEELKKKWASLGTEFELIYYDKIPMINQLSRQNKLIQQDKQIEELFKKVGAMKRETTNNYFIDLIFMMTKRVFIRNNITWINKKTFKKKMRGDTSDTTDSDDFSV